MFKNFVRALRLPFISASILPFVFGSLIAGECFNLFNFFFGLVCVAATHLGANLINDFADSRSGVDWQDSRFYGFFGGSKLIQKNLLSEGFFLSSGLAFFAVALSGVAALCFSLRSYFPILAYLLIILLSWSYSERPFRFSYHRLGEFFIFALFGPATVMGGYFIQTGIFPDQKSFLLSLPFGFFTTAILFANEVPDFPVDMKAGKSTWVGICGAEKAYILYYILVILGFSSIVLNIHLGYLSSWAYVCLVLVFPEIKAAGILKKYHSDKEKLLESSRLTILVQFCASVILVIAGIL